MILKIVAFFVIGTLQKWVRNGFGEENGVIGGSFFEMVKNFWKAIEFLVENIFFWEKILV